jgi:hypothetical protein
VTCKLWINKVYRVGDFSLELAVTRIVLARDARRAVEVVTVSAELS